MTNDSTPKNINEYIQQEGMEEIIDEQALIRYAQMLQAAINMDAAVANINARMPKSRDKKAITFADDKVNNSLKNIDTDRIFRYIAEGLSRDSKELRKMVARTGLITVDERI